MAEPPKQVVQHAGPQALPVGPDGRPMVVIMSSASNLVPDPSVQYSNLTIGPVTIMRAVPDDGDESIINAARMLARMVEYVVGVERYILANVFDPVSAPIHPATGERFAAPPEGYDPSSMPPYPADAA